MSIKIEKFIAGVNESGRFSLDPSPLAALEELKNFICNYKGKSWKESAFSRARNRYLGKKCRTLAQASKRRGKSRIPRRTKNRRLLLNREW
jgi:hypothetical protein